MMTSFFFIFRLTLAWMIAYTVVSISLHELFLGNRNGGEGIIVALGFLTGAFVIVTAFSHLRRVRLITGQVNASALSNRQRRQIEIPFEAGEAFDLVDAAIR